MVLLFYFKLIENNPVENFVIQNYYYSKLF